MRRLVVLFLSVTSVLPVVAQAQLTVDQLVALAIENNTGLERDRRWVRSARDALRLPPEVSASRIRLYTSYDSSGADLSDALWASSSVSVPILRQLSLRGSLSSQPSASASLELQPFEPRRPAAWERGYLVQWQTTLSYDERQLRASVEAAAHRLLASRALRSACKRAADAWEMAYQRAQQSFLSGELPFAQLETMRRMLAQAQSDATDSDSDYIYARDSLDWLLGMPEQPPDVVDVTPEDLKGLVERRASELALLQGVAPEPISLQLARLSLENTRDRLAYTVFRPDLSFSLGIDYSSYLESAFTASGSLSLSFSPSDLRARDRRDLAQSLADATDDVEAEMRAARTLERRLREKLRLAQDSLSLGERNAALAQSLLDEIATRPDNGVLDSVDLEIARASAATTHARAFDAAASVASAQACLLLIYPGR